MGQPTLCLDQIMRSATIHEAGIKIIDRWPDTQSHDDYSALEGSSLSAAEQRHVNGDRLASERHAVIARRAIQEFFHARQQT